MNKKIHSSLDLSKSLSNFKEKVTKHPRRHLCNSLNLSRMVVASVTEFRAEPIKLLNRMPQTVNEEISENDYYQRE